MMFPSQSSISYYFIISYRRESKREESMMCRNIKSRVGPKRKHNRGLPPLMRHSDDKAEFTLNLILLLHKKECTIANDWVEAPSLAGACMQVA